ncbi:NUDIX hydrolase [Risungbinella massiliensis]|uniref:NUDIX hydrolase n=1 Tax=Risungbinella massiliensis TaxID=1329796 RepID=UPI00069A8997|nr:NUDIX domain-containing protein [Risungbinella massiliensis]
MRKKEPIIAKPSLLLDRILRSPIKNQVNNYLRYYPTEATQLKLLLKHFHEEGDLYDRKSLPGHITASGIVVEDGKILMIYHPFLQKWLQPGGHVDPGETPLMAARREILEETGIPTKFHPWHQQHILPIDINIHPIPANPKKQEPSHFHYDFRYLLQVDTSKERVPKVEVDHEVTWKEVQEIEEENLVNLLVKLEKELEREMR